MRSILLLACLTCPASLFPRPVFAQKRAITFDDFIALKAVSDAQLSPDGKWVAYTVSTPSLQDNRNVARVWVAEVATGKARQLTGAPGGGADRQPRWSPDGRTLAFISTRDSGAQVWVLPIAGGDARKVSHLPDGASDPVWLPDGSGVLVVSDIKWPVDQEIDQRNGDYPTEARIWTGLMWRHWDDFRAGKRQHLFRVDIATGKGTDLTPVDHDVPTIATGGDGDVAVSRGGILVAMHGDSTVADNTNVDLYLVELDGSGLKRITTSPGADNTPRFSPDGRYISYLSMERAGFEADRQRLMLAPGLLVGGSWQNGVDVTMGWNLSIGSYTWCPNSKCIYAVVEERGRDNIYRIDIPGYKRTRVVSGGVNTGVQVGPDNKTLAYLHQSNTQPPEVWVFGKAARALSHHTDSAVATLDLPPLEEFGFVGALGDSVFGWTQKPPGFDAARKYPLVYLIHGGPQGAWIDSWGPRWNNQMFASRGWVVAEVNFHGSTGYGQKFTDAISQHWGDYPYEDVMKGVDAVARLPYVDSTRMGAAGASYGGYMVYWIAGHTNRFKVLVDHDGVFNTASMAGSTEELWFTDWEFGGPLYSKRELYEKWSPMNHVSDWKTPILIVHSQLDYRVDLSEGYQAFTAAKRMGVEAKFLYFPDEGHWVLRPRNRRIWWGTVLDWLEVHLNESPHP